ncbi:MAG: dTMP kinase [Patescibacteria group bacterium]
MTNHKGKFIVFEGPDGGGHSTQADLLKENLVSRGYDVLLTVEPTRTDSPEASAVSLMIRQVLQKQEILDPAELQVLFTEDRREHLETVIEPALRAGKVVISDRYFFSTFAYGSLDADLEWLIELNREFRTPDKAFALLVRPEVYLERIARRGTGSELFETLRNFRRLNEAYRGLAQRFPVLEILDGERPIPEIHADVLAKMKSVLK